MRKEIKVRNKEKRDCKKIDRRNKRRRERQKQKKQKQKNLSLRERTDRHDKRDKVF